MNKNTKLKALIPLMLLALWVVPLVVGAQVTAPAITTPTNPLPSDEINLQDITNIIGSIANFLIAIGVIIAIIFIVVGGIRYMAAGGDSAKAGEARTWIINGLIGAAIVLGVGVLLATAEYILNSIAAGTL